MGRGGPSLSWRWNARSVGPCRPAQMRSGICFPWRSMLSTAGISNSLHLVMAASKPHLLLCWVPKRRQAPSLHRCPGRVVARLSDGHWRPAKVWYASLRSISTICPDQSRPSPQVVIVLAGDGSAAPLFSMCRDRSMGLNRSTDGELLDRNLNLVSRKLTPVSRSLVSGVTFQHFESPRRRRTLPSWNFSLASDGSPRRPYLGKSTGM